MGAFWFKEEGKKTSARAMNTLSLQKMKMAARMSCLPSHRKMRSSPLQGRMVVPRMVATSEKMSSWRFLRPSKAINVRGLKILKTYKLC